MRWLILPLALALVTACSDPGPVNPYLVYVLDDYFSPSRSTIKIDSTVTFQWSGVNPHNVTYTAGPLPLPANSSTLTGGEFQTTFTIVGTYDTSR